MGKFILICLIAIFWFHAVDCACNFPTTLLCQSQAISITLCISQDPNTCTSPLQCSILAVYDPSTDPNLTKNLIITGPIIGGVITFQTKKGQATANNKFPIDVQGVAYKDPVHGPTNLYYNSPGVLLAADDQLYDTANAFCGVPTSSPTYLPTFQPTKAPTATPTAIPTAIPTATPTATPTSLPTATPTAGPTSTPTSTPTSLPTASPTASPTYTPTSSPTSLPTALPTAIPTAVPTSIPTAYPTPAPTSVPTFEPTAAPTAVPTAQPTTGQPSFAPTSAPTSQPSLLPTSAPTCAAVATTDQAFFTVKQQLSNLTSSYFSGSSTAKQAFTDTVTAVLGCTAPTTVAFTGSSRRRLQQAVPVTSVEYKIIFGYNGPPSAAYNALVAAIDNAIVTGHFTALLRDQAFRQEALQLLGASALNLPIFSNYTLISPSTSSDGTSSAAPSNRPAIIAGSVSVVLVALLALLVFIWCRRRAPLEKKEGGAEPSILAVWRKRLSSRAASAENGAEPQQVDGVEPEDVEQANEDTPQSHKSSVATSIASLFTPRTTMSVGSDRSLGASDEPTVEHAEPESESKEPGEYTSTSEKRLSSRVVIPMNLLPPTINRQVQPSSDPSSRVPPLPGRQPRRSIKYSFFKRRGSRGSESSKMETMSFRSSASHTGTLADLDLALGRFSIERELERQRYHEEYDRGDDVHSQTSDGGSGRESSVAWDGASVMSGHTAGMLEFPVPFRGDPLSQVNVQIGWHCLYADGKYLVEVSESPSNLTSFLLEGRRLKALNMPCTQVDSGFFHYTSYDDLKGFVLRQLPFSATSCLGRYEDQMLLMVTDARHNLQKDASKKPLWRWVAKELTPDDTIQSGASILIVVRNKLH